MDLPELDMIAHRQYLLEDARTNRPISFDTPWESSFIPGRKVYIGIVFGGFSMPAARCPACLTFENPQGKKEFSVAW